MQHLDNVKGTENSRSKERGNCSLTDFLMEGKKLVRYMGSSEYVKIPDGIEFIGSSAFRFNKQLKSVYIADSVTFIDDRAFSVLESGEMGHSKPGEKGQRIVG